MTRVPSGLADLPLVLVEGEEFSGRWEAVDALAGSHRVFVLDPTGRVEGMVRDVELVEHARNLGGVKAAIEEAAEEPWRDGRPNVVALDVTWLWGLLRDQMDARARKSKATMALLADDPHAEIKTPSNLWRDADTHFWSVVNLLADAPVVGVLVAEGHEDEAGWKVDTHQGVLTRCTAWVRCRRPRAYRLVGADGVDPGGVDGELDGDVLGWVLGLRLPWCGVKQDQARQLLAVSSPDATPGLVSEVLSAFDWSSSARIPVVELGPLLADPSVWLAPADDQAAPAPDPVGTCPDGKVDPEGWRAWVEARGFGVGGSPVSDGHDGSVGGENASGGTAPTDPTVPDGGDPWDEPRVGEPLEYGGGPCGVGDEALRGLDEEGSDDGDGS